MCATTPDNSLCTIRWYLLKGVLHALLRHHTPPGFELSQLFAPMICMSKAVEKPARGVWPALEACRAPPYRHLFFLVVGRHAARLWRSAAPTYRYYFLFKHLVLFLCM